MIRRFAQAARKDSETKTVLRDAGIALVIKYGGAAATVLMLAMLARAMSPEAFGRYAFAFSLGALCAIAGSLGQRAFVMRQGSAFVVDQDWEGLHQFLRFGYTMVLSGTGILAIGLVAVGALGLVPDGPALFAAAGFAVALGLSGYQSNALVTLKNLPLALLPRDIFWRLGMAAIAGTALWVGLAPLSLGTVVTLSVAMLLIACLAQIVLAPNLTAAMKRKGSGLPKDWIKDSVPIWANSVINNSASNVSIVILGLVLAPAVVGGMFLALRLSEVTALAIRALASVVAPQVGRLAHQEDHVALQRVVTLSASLSALAALATFACFVLFGDWILALFNPAFAEFQTVLIVISFGMLIAALAGPGVETLMMMGHEPLSLRITFWANGAGLLAIVVTGLAGSPLAVAWALALTRIVLFSWRAWAVWRHTGIMLFVPLRLHPKFRGPMAETGA